MESLPDLLQPISPITDAANLNPGIQFSVTAVEFALGGHPRVFGQIYVDDSVASHNKFNDYVKTCFSSF